MVLKYGAYVLLIAAALVFSGHAIRVLFFAETISQANCLWAAGEAPTERGVSIKQQACRTWYPER